MSWDDLHSEIAGIFADYSWRADDMQRALEEWGAWREANITPKDEFRRAKNREATRRWHEEAKKNPKWVEANRRRMREYSRSRYEKDAAHREAKRQRSRERQREHFRALGVKPRHGRAIGNPQRCGACGELGHNARRHAA